MGGHGVAPFFAAGAGSGRGLQWIARADQVDAAHGPSAPGTIGLRAHPWRFKSRVTPRGGSCLRRRPETVGPASDFVQRFTTRGAAGVECLVTLTPDERRRIAATLG